MGEYRAPKSRHELRDYYWFCLEHVRRYNAAWDYFAGMSQEEIEQYHHNDAFWHRPTWRLGVLSDKTKTWFSDGIGDEFGLFGGGPRVVNGANGHGSPPFTAADRRALAELNLEWPVSLKEIKDRYKVLVKKHHPDANGGDKVAEERLKTIIEAYTHLRSCAYP